MAKITPGALISDIRQSHGLITFARNRGGLYTKARVTPANPKTSWQTANRNAFLSFAKAWGATLSATDRQSWEAGAQGLTTNKSAQPHGPMNGFALFMRMHMARAWFDTSIHHTYVPPTHAPEYQSLEITTAAIGATNLTIAWTPATTPFFAPIVESTPGMPPATTNPRRQEAIFTNFSSLQTSPLNVYAPWLSKFGTPIAGTKIFVFLHMVGSPQDYISKRVMASAIWQP